MTRKTLTEILDKHKKWLNGEEGGERANLRNADLQDANLQYANLRNADLQDAILRNADLRNADLQDANLQYAILRYADLQYAILRNADLRNADLQDANLQYANLRGADLQEANLDYSCFPLWCGGAHFKTDMQLVNQLLAHICTLDVEGTEFTELREKILPYAGKSHRAKDLGLL